MNFKLLKEFLSSGLTQKEFAQNRQRSSTAVSHKLQREMRQLLDTNVINAEEIIKDVSMNICDVRNNREGWLKAIDSYEAHFTNPVKVEKDNRKISELTVTEFISLMRSISNK